MAVDSHYYIYSTPHGPLTLQGGNQGLSRVVFGRRELPVAFKPTALTNQAASEIQEYLAGRRCEFSVPLDLEGTPFQREVWEAVCAVPYGMTATAASIAGDLGRPHSYRQVGAAIAQSSLVPFVPIHRIVKASAAGPEERIFQGLRNLERRR